MPEERLRRVRGRWLVCGRRGGAVGVTLPPSRAATGGLGVPAAAPGGGGERRTRAGDGGRLLPWLLRVGETGAGPASLLPPLLEMMAKRTPRAVRAAV